MERDMSEMDPARIEPGQDIEIGLMRPADASGVAALGNVIMGLAVELMPAEAYD